MPLFRRKASRQVANEPLPDYDDTRWRSHLRTNAIETDHYCNEFVNSINADRKEAARLFKNNDESRSRTHAESALNNKRLVTALGSLSPLCTALYQRSEPLAGYTSLVQVPEPARSGIVTIIYASDHLNLKHLAETVGFLRDQFGPVHIDQILRGEGELAHLVTPSVREALDAGSPSRSEVNAEIASSVKEYFGVSVPSSQPAPAPVYAANNPPSQYADPPIPQKESETFQNNLSTPLSVQSSDGPGPLSPEFKTGSESTPLHERNMRTPSPPHAQIRESGRMYQAAAAPLQRVSADAYTARQAALGAVDSTSLQQDVSLGAQQGENVTQTSRQIFHGTEDALDGSDEGGNAYQTDTLSPGTGIQTEAKFVPKYLQVFQDSDEVLLTRYSQLRSIISV